MRSGDDALESVPPSLAPSDAILLFTQILTRPETLSKDVVFWAGGALLQEDEAASRSVLGWRRGGGAVVLGCTTGTATEALLVESLQLAATSARWPVGRWDEVLQDFWGTAAGALGASIGERWGLRPTELQRAAAWTEAAWGAPPAPGQPAVGLVAARVSEGLRRAVDWLTTADREIAAFELARAPAGSAQVYASHLVAGGWRPAPERPLPARATTPLDVTPTTATQTALQAAIERTCRAAGGTVVWRREWVRFDGPWRSLRLFPDSRGIEVQFMGANEGTLLGLRYRFGVPLGTLLPPAAAPGGHLWLTDIADITPALDKLLAFWLGRVGPGLHEASLRDP